MIEVEIIKQEPVNLVGLVDQRKTRGIIYNFNTAPVKTVIIGDATGDIDNLSAGIYLVGRGGSDDDLGSIGIVGVSICVPLPSSVLSPPWNWKA